MRIELQTLARYIREALTGSAAKTEMHLTDPGFPCGGAGPSYQTKKTTRIDTQRGRDAHDELSSHERRREVHSSEVRCSHRMGAPAMHKNRNT